MFFRNSGWNWGGLGVSGRRARSIRNFSLDLWQDLVLPNAGQVDFHDFRKYWNFNELEMALKTFRFVQGLHITPLFFFLWYFKTTQIKLICLKSEIWKNENIKVWKRRAPKQNRDLSSQKCFNFRGVLIGDKTDWEKILGNWEFRLGTLAPESQPWGTGLLRLGEPLGGSWGNPGARLPLPGL